MKLRDYQARAVTDLFAWWTKHQEDADIPLLVLPTAAGKSVICAEIVRQMWDQWPDYRPRTVVLVPSKELAEQNAAKLTALLPDDIHVGFVSASLGKKQHHADVIVATIGSIHKSAHLLGDIKVVVIDECFVAGTKISTPKGQINIDKVRCGDLVFNTRGVGVVEAVSCRQVAETLLVELDDGTKFECTGNHPIFTDDGWQKAEKLEIGTPLFRIEDMSCLWSRVQTLDQKGRQRKSNFSNVGTILGKAELLLREVCKEITPDGSECRSTQTNAGNSKKNQASTYSAWRKRAIAAFATVSASSCVGGRMDSGICNQDQSGAFERDISECLQGGHLLSGKDDLHRIGWGESWQRREENAGQEERPISCGPRVARVSRIKRESPVLVFNLQVSGHPSYFANGIVAHNCHLIGHKDEGGYRTLLSDIYQTNANVRVIGLTATPYRLGHGYITDKPAIFDALIEPVSIEELIFKGFLSTLRSKLTATKLEVNGVHKRGGEYIESELQAKVDTSDKNAKVVQEVINLAAGRKSWLIFCAGVAHAQHIKDALIDQGIVAECVTGDTPSAERDRILREFKAGTIRALTNANVLTTGFDAPMIDLIAMLRPTMSPGLYVQMAGRGLRIADGKADCMVLDFAGVVEQHGPITAVRPPPKKGDKVGEAPVKVCDHCQEICALSVRVCPACGAEFPEPVKPALKLSNLDIMGVEGIDMDVTAWTWRKHISRASGKEMLSCTFYGGLSDAPVTEYLAVTHDGYAGEKSRRLLAEVAHRAGVVLDYGTAELHEMAQALTEGQPPAAIEFKREGKFFTVLKRTWT